MRQVIKIQGIVLFLLTMIMVFPLEAYCPRCSSCHCQSDYQEAEGRGCRSRPTYNPLIRYFPYCSIYHKSCVYQSVDDEVSWPSRRDEDLVDELTR